MQTIRAFSIAATAGLSGMVPKALWPMLKTKSRDPSARYRTKALPVGRFRLVPMAETSTPSAASRSVFTRPTSSRPAFEIVPQGWPIRAT